MSTVNNTSDAITTINRVVDIFPSHQQQQVRTQLSFVLRGVFAQQLLPRSSGRGRVLASEIMLVTSAVKALIRDDKIHQIYSIMQTGGKLGMKTMNQSLYELCRASIINFEDGMQATLDPDDLRRMFQRKG